MTPAHFPPWFSWSGQTIQIIIKISWIESFFTNLKQRIRLCDGYLSDWATVTSGVLQSNVLGPILFCLVADRLKLICSNTSVIKFADDINFLHFLRRGEDDNLQTEYNNCTGWSTRHRLHINAEKCAVMNTQTTSKISLSPNVRNWILADCWISQTYIHITYYIHSYL